MGKIIGETGTFHQQKSRFFDITKVYNLTVSCLHFRIIYLCHSLLKAGHHQSLGHQYHPHLHLCLQ